MSRAQGQSCGTEPAAGQSQLTRTSNDSLMDIKGTDLAGLASTHLDNKRANLGCAAATAAASDAALTTSWCLPELGPAADVCAADGDDVPHAAARGAQHEPSCQQREAQAGAAATWEHVSGEDALLIVHALALAPRACEGG